MSQESAEQLKFDGQGLLPAVIQDWLDGTVLMLGMYLATWFLLQEGDRQPALKTGTPGVR